MNSENIKSAKFHTPYKYIWLFPFNILCKKIQHFYFDL